MAHHTPRPPRLLVLAAAAAAAAASSVSARLQQHPWPEQLPDVGAAAPIQEVPSDGAGYTGYDIVFIAGQSNAVGVSRVADPEAAVADSTEGLPVFFLNAGQDNQPNAGSLVPVGWVPWGTPPDSFAVQAAQEHRLHIASTGTSFDHGKHNNEFGVAFAKQYIAAGRLRHGRALLIVSTAVGGTGFFGLGQGVSLYGFPNVSPSNPTRLLPTWAPWGPGLPACSSVYESHANVPMFSAARLPAVGWVNKSTGVPRHMTLAQHAEYRVDLALSLDPATGTVPPGPRPFGVRHPSNIVVAILWHQGENDAGQTDEASAHNGVAAWGACMELTIRRWRSRYGRDVPFIAGTFSTALPLWQPFVPSYEAYLRYNYDPTGIAGTTYGQPGGPPRCADATGRPASCYHQLDSPGSMVPLSEPLARLGLADSWYRVEPPPAGAAARPVLDLVPYDPWYASDAKSEHAVFGAPACANATVGGRLFVGAGPVWPQVGNGDCANYGHFSVRGLQLMGQRYWDAYARIVGPQQAV